MRVIRGIAENFASYAEVRFTFTNKGLTLVHGATGAGKSALCDIIPWGLFGKTAKNGAVDEVLSWPGDKVTKVMLALDSVTVIRTRGHNSKDNDLSFWPTDGVVTRGKDLNDTQRLLNNLLGVDFELYLASAYFHEFSQSAAFFTAAAKQRRVICEQIVDLSLPKKLSEKLIEAKKVLSKELENKERTALIVNTTINTYKSRSTSLKTMEAQWDKQQANKIEALKNSDINFAKHQEQQILRLSDMRATLISKLHKHIPILDEKNCSVCGAPNKLARDAEKMQHENQLLEVKIAAIEQQIDNLPKDNSFERQLKEVVGAKNPHTIEIATIKGLIDTESRYLDLILLAISSLSSEHTNCEILLDCVAIMRSQLIEQAISDIQYNTNSYLSQYFDAEIKVEFLAQDADKLMTTIYKDANECSYTQLSKGQRQILKLCFGIAIMKQAANNSLTSFSQVFFDESLDGLDENMKIKAFNLFNSLCADYESIFVVEHSSILKEQFLNRIKVQLVNGKSELYEEA